MISFNLIEHGEINHGYGKVEFETNSPEMYRLVIDMINAISDAIAYRNRVERVERRE